MLRRSFAGLCLSALTLSFWSAGHVAAEPADDLLRAMGAPRIVAIMRQEGIDYGADLGEELLPGRPSAAWDRTVSDLYNVDAMMTAVRGGFIEALGTTDVSELLAFYEGDQGSRAVALEISAREAMVDDDVEEAARITFRQIAASGEEDPLLDHVAALIGDNDYVEANVAGALNASLMFYRGLVEGGAFELSEQEILSEVRSQEDETREDTREWLHAYFLMAHGPLSPDARDLYREMARTEAGMAVNEALFSGFNRMYDDLSYALGLAAAREMRAEEL